MATHCRGVVVAFVVGLASCGGSGAPSPTTPTPTAGPAVENRAPTISSLAVTPAFGVADLQPFAFSVVASDPDGDALVCRWDLGYGVTDSPAGTSFTGVYRGGAGGVNQVSVTCSDPKALSASRSALIVIGTAYGEWTIREGGGRLNGAVLQLYQGQNGAVTGDYLVPGVGVDHITAAQPGAITPDGSVSLPLRIGSRPVVLVGAIDTASAKRIAGTVDGSAFVMSKP